MISLRSQLSLKKSVGVLTGDHHYTTFLKIRRYNFKIQFNQREHFNRDRTAQPGKKKKQNNNPTIKVTY